MYPPRTATDKLITDYLTRHSASGSHQSAKRHIGRQPLAAMENLQEALTDLQLAVESSRPVCASNKAALLPHSHVLDSSRDYGSQAVAEAGGTIAPTRSVSQEESADLQSHTVQSYPTHCSPALDSKCVSRASTVPSVAHEHECSGATYSHSVPCHNVAAASGPLHEADVDRLAASGAAIASMTTDQHIDQSRVDMQSDPRTPNGNLLWEASASGRTPYFTQQFQSIISSPSPHVAGDEQWFTPTGIDSPGCETNDAEGCDKSYDHDYLIGAAVSPGNTLDRSDSPSLLYGKGSAFNTDVLGEDNGFLGHWLT